MEYTHFPWLGPTKKEEKHFKMIASIGKYSLLFLHQTSATTATTIPIKTAIIIDPKRSTSKNIKITTLQKKKQHETYHSQQ